MKFVKSLLKRPVSVLVLLLAVIVFGGAALTGMPLNFMPDFSMPVQLVIVTWPGSDADSVDRLVAQPISDKCVTLSDISSTVSYSYDNYAMVQLVYNYGADEDDIYSDLKSAMDNLKADLPSDCNDPTIMQISADAMSTMTLSVSADSGVDIASVLDDKIKPDLQGISGVAQVEVSGTRDDYYRVVLDEEKMQQYGLSISSVASAIGEADFEIPLGTVTMGSQDIALGSKGTLSVDAQMRQFPIQTPSGQLIRLGDIAQFLRLDKKDADSISRYNGRESVLLSVTKQDSAASVGVCSKVIDTLDGYAGEGISYEIINNEADNITDTLQNIFETLLIGVALAMAALFLFFGDWKGSLVVGVSMPLSVLLAVIVLNFIGYDMNVLTGTGLILAIGMIVDNSIVILESCFRFRQQGLSFQEAAAQGTSTMLMSILAGTLTTVVVYIPLTISKGMSGMMFGPLLWTIILTLLASFLCAIVVVPLAFTLLTPKAKEDIPVNRLLHRFQNFYRRVMPKLLRKPGKVMLIGVGSFLAAVLLATQMDFVLIPNNYDGSISVDVSFRAGTKLAVMDERVQQLEAVLLADENFKNVTLSISDDSASFTAYAVDHCKRSSEKAAELYTTEFSNYPGMDVSVSPTSSTSGMSEMGSTSNTTTVMLLGNDMDALRAGAAQVQDVMAQTPGVIRVENPFDQSRVKGHLEIDPLRAQNAGTSPAAISMQVRYLLNGLTAATVDDGDQEYDIVLEYPKGKYEDVMSVMDYPIRTQTGKLVTLHDVADVTYDSTLPVLTRQDGDYAVTLTATTTDDAKYTAANAISAAAKALDFPEGVSIGTDAQTSMQNDEISTLASALLASLFLVFLVMAVQFNSVKMSIMVMICIPLCLIGSFTLVFLTGRPMSMFGLMGFMMLIGISVNNGIYLVDGTTQLRVTMPLEQALIEAGTTRLRPILMTTLTTIISMIPMIFTTSPNLVMMKEMSYIVIGGLIASTALAMFLVPPFYLLMRGERVDGSKRPPLFKKKKCAKPSAEAALSAAESSADET